MFVVFFIQFGASSHGVGFPKTIGNSCVSSFLYLRSLSYLFVNNVSVYQNLPPLLERESWDMLLGMVFKCYSSEYGESIFFTGNGNPGPSPVFSPHRPRGGYCCCWCWCWQGAGNHERWESGICWNIDQPVTEAHSSGFLPAPLSVISEFWVSQSCSHLCSRFFLHVIWIVVFLISKIVSVLFLEILRISVHQFYSSHFPALLWIYSFLKTDFLVFLGNWGGSR